MTPEDIAAARPLVPVLRRLREAGWERLVYPFGLASEHVWRRNHRTMSPEQISVWNKQVKAHMGDDASPWSMPLQQTPERVVAWLDLIRAFDPAPKAVPLTLTPAELRVRAEVLRRAANDPAVTDDMFAILAPAIEGRPIEGLKGSTAE